MFSDVMVNFREFLVLWCDYLFVIFQFQGLVSLQTLTTTEIKRWDDVLLRHIMHLLFWFYYEKQFACLP